MGLDTVAARALEESITEEDWHAFLEADIHLVRGVLTFDEVHTFRGKVYDLLIHHLTGVSLYQEWIPPEVVGQISKALNECSPQELVEKKIATSPEEVGELPKFFNVCADRRLGLIGAW